MHADGGEVSVEGRQSLKDSIAAWGDPYVAVAVENHVAITFLTGLRVKVDPDHQAPLVLKAVEAALRDAFSFARRSFGDDVSSAVLVITLLPFLFRFLGPIYLASALVLGAIFMRDALRLWRESGTGSAWTMVAVARL